MLRAGGSRRQVRPAFRFVIRLWQRWFPRPWRWSHLRRIADESAVRTLLIDEAKKKLAEMRRAQLRGR